MISFVSPLKYPMLPGVEVFPLDGKPQRGKPQRVLVVMSPNAVIPLHRHEADASMFIVAGSAKLLSDDENNGAIVQAGQQVLFARQRDHGFQAEEEGMSFLSANGGIVDAGGSWDFVLKGGE